jgi:hypothetical protein
MASANFFTGQVAQQHDLHALGASLRGDGTCRRRTCLSWHIQTGSVHVKDHLHANARTVQLQGLVGDLVGVAKLGAFDLNSGHGRQGSDQGGTQNQGACKGFHAFSE